MRRSHIAMIVMLLVGLASTTSADEHRWKVIVHPDNPIATIDRDLLRGAFLKKETVWSDGQTIRPVDLSPKFPAREQFTRKVLKKTPAQLKTYWAQQIFSGKGVPPPEAATIDAAIEYVLTHPGAIGYVPRDVDPRGAKVIEVE